MPRPSRRPARHFVKMHPISDPRLMGTEGLPETKSLALSPRSRRCVHHKFRHVAIRCRSCPSSKGTTITIITGKCRCLLRTNNTMPSVKISKDIRLATFPSKCPSNHHGSLRSQVRCTLESNRQRTRSVRLRERRWRPYPRPVQRSNRNTLNMEDPVANRMILHSAWPSMIRSLRE